MSARPNMYVEIALLLLLSCLWGSSYLMIRVALEGFPPLTLIAIRVVGGALFLSLILAMQSGIAVPRGAANWRALFVLSILNSSGAWLLLAWGQQYVDSGLAGVLNSTSPIFVVLISLIILRDRSVTALRFAGAFLGIGGVLVVMGPETLRGLGGNLLAQLAVIGGAALYGGAAIYGRRFGHLHPLATAWGTMICASCVLLPLCLILEDPFTLTPSAKSIGAAAWLAILSTGIALLIYFRLIATLGSLGAASQAYLRSGVSVALGVVIMGETISVGTGAGLALIILGVILINLPRGVISHRLRQG